MSRQKIEIPRSIILLNVCIGAFGSLLLQQFSGDMLASIGFAAGFFLFLANALLIASLSGAVIRASLGSGEKALGYAKKAGIFLALIKVAGLFVALYVALIYFALPPTFFALGSFASLVSVVASFAADYLKRLANEEQMAEKKG